MRASRVRRPLGPPGSSGVWQRAGLCPPPTPFGTSVQARTIGRVSLTALLASSRRAVAQARRLRRLLAWAWGPATNSIISKTETSVDAETSAGKATQVTAKAPSLRMSCASRSRNPLIRPGAAPEELVENVAAIGESQWMGGNFLEYAGSLNWNDLPVDAHELVALCAPSPVFIYRRVDPGRR